MKRILSTIILIFACVAIGVCGINETLNQAHTLYSKATTVADYQRVIKKYESARADVGYVAAEHEKAINEGIRKCNSRIAELTPRLSVDGSTSTAYVRFDAGGGSRTLSISTNQSQPDVSAVPSWINVNSVYSTGITFYCYPNSSTSSRSDYFYVNAGGLSVRIDISQAGASSADTYLRVDGNSSVTTSFGSDGGTRTFSVSTDASSWSTWGVPSFCEVTNRTATSFTLRCNANTSASSRNDYMKIKTDKHEVRIDITQSGASSSSSSGSLVKGSIEKVWVEQNVDVDGENGIAVHAKFDVSGMKDKKVRMVAYFYDSSNVNAIKDTNGSYCTSGSDPNVSCGKTLTPSYDNSTFNDAIVKIPYSELHQTGYSSVTLTVDVLLWDYSSDPHTQITRKNNAAFSFVPGTSVHRYGASSSRSAKVNRVWVDYDQWQDGMKGMLIHTEFETEGCKDENMMVAVYFYTESGSVLKDYDGKYKSSDGNVATHLNTTATYDSSIWKDFKIFMPYDQLHMASGKHELKFYVTIYSPLTKEFLANSDYVHFTFTK